MAVNGQFYISYNCFKDKRSTPGFYWDNADDASLQAFVAAANAIVNAVPGEQFVQERRLVDAGSAAIPPNTSSRGKKFVVKYRDSVTNKSHQVELPGADDTILGGDDFLDLTQAPGLTVKNTFETAFVSPEGNPVVVTRIEFNTRNIE